MVWKKSISMVSLTICFWHTFEVGNCPGIFFHFCIQDFINIETRLLFVAKRTIKCIIRCYIINIISLCLFCLLMFLHPPSVHPLIHPSTPPSVQMKLSTQVNIPFWNITLLVLCSQLIRWQSSSIKLVEITNLSCIYDCSADINLKKKKLYKCKL